MPASAKAVTNKENAQHSTGPRTEEGKRTSSLNAFRHGLTATTVVLPTEDMAVYQEYSRRLLLDYEPVGAMEEQLAQTAIDAQWRLNRVAALETNLLALAHYEPAPEHLAAIEDPQTRAALLEANALIKYERQLRNLHLQEQRLHRIVRRSLDNLTALQRAREENHTAPAAAAPENGFDFSPAEIRLHYVAPPSEFSGSESADPRSEKPVLSSAA